MGMKPTLPFLAKWKQIPLIWKHIFMLFYALFDRRRHAANFGLASIRRQRIVPTSPLLTGARQL
jgi:hypothetical protein